MVSREQKNKVIEETKLLVKMFLETNKSDKELAEATGISKSTVGRRLTNKENILECFPDVLNLYDEIMTKRKQNLYDGKRKGAKKAAQKNAKNEEYQGFRIPYDVEVIDDTEVVQPEENKIENIEFSKVDLDLIYDSLDEKYNFLSNIVANFGISKNNIKAYFKSEILDFILNNLQNYQENANQFEAVKNTLSFLSDDISRNSLNIR